MQTADSALDAGALAAALGPLAARLEVETVASCGSTNSVLLEAAESGTPRLLVADHQSAGRGRRGRRWYDAPGGSILLALGRRMRRPPRGLGGLSLAAGVAVARALRSAGIAAVALFTFLNAWNAQDTSSDCDGNGVIDTRDVLFYLSVTAGGLLLAVRSLEAQHA